MTNQRNIAIHSDSHPIQKAAILYGNNLPELIGWYLDNGFIYSGSDLFFMATKHNHDRLINKEELNKLDKVDCWYVQYVAGNISRIFDICPEELEWIVFEREASEGIRCYKFNRLKKKLGSNNG